MEELMQKLYDTLVEHNYDLTNEEVVEVSQELDIPIVKEMKACKTQCMD